MPLLGRIAIPFSFITDHPLIPCIYIPLYQYESQDPIPYQSSRFDSPYSYIDSTYSCLANCFYHRKNAICRADRILEDCLCLSLSLPLFRFYIYITSLLVRKDVEMISCIDSFDITALYHTLSQSKSSSLQRFLFYALQQSCFILPSSFAFFSPRWWLTAFDSLDCVDCVSSLQHILLLLCSFPLHFPLLRSFLSGSVQNPDSVMKTCCFFVKEDKDSGIVPISQPDKSIITLVPSILTSDM